MSDIEAINAYKSIEPYLSTSDAKELADKMGISSPTLENRLEGLRHEDEFALLMYFSDECKHILGFDEGVSFLSKSHSCDFYVELKSGRKILIEVKSVADGNSYKISDGNLDKRIAFANDFGIELYFAIKILGAWGLYEASLLKGAGIKITHPVDLNKSNLNSMFGLKTYILRSGFKAVSSYSKQDGGISEIKHEEHGSLQKYRLEFSGKPLLDSDNGDDIDASTLIEHLHDLMSIQSQDIQKKPDGTTIVIEELTANSLCNEYSLFLSPLKHTLTKFGNRNNSTSYFKSLLESRKDILLKPAMRAIVESLNSKAGEPVFFSPTTIIYLEDGTFEAE